MVVVLGSEVIEVYPTGRLLYYPVVPPGREPDATVFARGESYEFRDRNFAAAARVYRRLASSADSSVRAAALLRLARTERKAGDSEAALQAFEDLATLGSTPVGSLPAELVARGARLDVLQAASRHDEFRSES